MKTAKKKMIVNNLIGMLESPNKDSKKLIANTVHNGTEKDVIKLMTKLIFK